MRRWLPCIVAVAALTALLGGLALFEGAKDGIAIEERSLGGTPVSVYRVPGAHGPTVIIAHGFSGSRAMVQALALSLARAGYRAVTLDFPGHGDNPSPMSAEFDDLRGATRQLQNAIAAVIDAEAAEPGQRASVALIGHSMATDVIVRLAARDARVGPLVAVSMYSEAIDETAPPRLLAISGAFEPGLRKAALAAVRQIDPSAEENSIVESPDGRVRRGALVAPGVEHVGVLYSAATLRAAVDWLDEAFGRAAQGEPAPVSLGLPILLVLCGAFALFWPLTRLLPPRMRSAQTRAVPWPALLAPPLLTPLVLIPLSGNLIPMPGMTYLTAHLAVYGLIALACLWRGNVRPGFDGWRAPALLLVYGIAVIAVLIDRTFSDFLPAPARWAPLAAMALGAVPFMLADSLMLKARPVPWWLRFAARFAVFGSLAAGMALMPGERLIIGFFFPVLLLHFLVFGTMARWLEARAPAPSLNGAAQGLLLAYALASVVPLIGADA